MTRKPSPSTALQLNTDAIDDTTLALLYLTLHDRFYAWKGHDWEALTRLHERGLIENPRNKSKSIAFTESGLEQAARLFGKLFIASQDTD